MLKNILKVNGAQKMSKNELQTINGGGFAAACTGDCNDCQEGSGSSGVCQRVIGPGFDCHYECFYPGNNDL